MTRKRVTKKKHKNLPRQELLNVWINGHNEHILSVPSRENVPYGLPFSNEFGIRLNGLGYPFAKIVIRSNGSGYAFEKEFV